MAVPLLVSGVSSRFVEALSVEYDVDPLPLGVVLSIFVAALVGRIGTPRTGILGIEGAGDEVC